MPFNASKQLHSKSAWPIDAQTEWFTKLSQEQQEMVHAELKTRVEAGQGKHPLLDVPIGYKIPSDTEPSNPPANPPAPVTPPTGQQAGSPASAAPVPVESPAVGPSGNKESDKGKAPAVGDDSSPGEEITEAVMNKMWDEMDLLDVSSIDSDALKIFEYQGFNPDSVLKSLLETVRDKKIDREVFKNDVLTLCAIAVIKGSVNDHNVKKISDEGQKALATLEQRYNIKRGSGRGEKPNVITVSRIAAAFPGKIVQMIQSGKVAAKKFMGPFKTYTLPAVLRHQSFPAAIPASLPERTKTFLLSLSVAFSVDQSLNITPDKKTKPDLVALYESQRNFIYLTADGPHPRDSVRVSIFKSIILDYESLLTCARATAGIIPDFKIIPKEDFMSDVATV